MSGRGRGRGVRRDGPGGGFPPRDHDYDDRGRRGGEGDRDADRHRHNERRRGEGLGYDARDARGRRDPPPRWERDRGGVAPSAGRGRGSSSDVSFVRGDVAVEHGGRHDVVAPGLGRGRGRGRGRGVDNRPAWMAGGAGDGPAGGGGTAAAAADPSLDDLLARARQAKTERREVQPRGGGAEPARPPPSRRDHPAVGQAGGPPGPAPKGESPADEAERRRREEEAERRAEEERREATRRAEEEERKRLEREREEDERRQLLALVEADGGGPNKRGAAEDDGGFEFETEEEREARAARRRREERRKRLRVVAESAEEKKDDDDGGAAAASGMDVDEPRNAAGIVKSEAEDEAALRERASNAGGRPGGTEEKEDDGGTGSFDMFASDGDTPAPDVGGAGPASSAAATSAQECDDPDGYYKPTSGEVIGLKREGGGRGGGRGGDAAGGPGEGENSDFRVLGLIGKGVFSSVVKCVEVTGDGTGGAAAGRVVAMKIIRNNEIMARAALKEMRILRMLCRRGPAQRRKKARRQQRDQGGDGDDANGDEEEDDEEEDRKRQLENHHIVRLLDVDPDYSPAPSASGGGDPAAYYAVPPPTYRNHSCFLFEYIPYNLREVLGKFGSGVGINLAAVRSYARQLFVALVHLEKHRVVHADLKPDNILVSANFSTIKLADFGSAFFETDHDNDPTPYLVSRFYRPPEVILGLEYDRNVDLWSASVTLAELFTGSVLFPGQSNNDMLVRFMDCMGPLSHRMVKRHALSYERMGLTPHFEVGQSGGTYQLRRQDVDRVTGRPVVRLTNVLSSQPDRRIAQVLLRSARGADAGERIELTKFADLLNRCLALDPGRRMPVREALRHDFFVKRKRRDEQAGKDEGRKKTA